MGVKTFLMVFVGGGCGCVSRVLVYIIINGIAKNNITAIIATATVNIIGAFLIGFFSELASTKFLVLEQYKPFVISGFLGGFTTFSAFSLETTNLLQQHRYLFAFIYVCASVFGTICAVNCGKYIVKI